MLPSHVVGVPSHPASQPLPGLSIPEDVHFVKLPPSPVLVLPILAHLVLPSRFWNVSAGLILGFFLSLFPTLLFLFPPKLPRTGSLLTTTNAGLCQSWNAETQFKSHTGMARAQQPNPLCCLSGLHQQEARSRSQSVLQVIFLQNFNTSHVLITPKLSCLQGSKFCI